MAIDFAPPYNIKKIGKYLSLLFIILTGLITFIKDTLAGFLSSNSIYLYIIYSSLFFFVLILSARIVKTDRGMRRIKKELGFIVDDLDMNYSDIDRIPKEVEKSISELVGFTIKTGSASNELTLKFINSVLLSQSKINKGKNYDLVLNLLAIISTMKLELKCDVHKKLVESIFNGVLAGVRGNTDAAMLLLGYDEDKMLDDIDISDSYSAIQLSVWSSLFHGEGLFRNYKIIDDTKYLFVTWDITNIESWLNNGGLASKLVRMLQELGKRAVHNNLFIHRYIIIEPDSFKRFRQEFHSKVWNPCFKPYVHNTEESRFNYRIDFIDSGKLKSIKSGFENREQRDFNFNDIAFFSTSEILRIGKEKGITEPLPDPPTTGDDSEYAYFQYSDKIKRDNNEILNLYLLSGINGVKHPDFEESARNTSNTIKQKRSICKGLISTVENDAYGIKCNDYVKSILGIDYITSKGEVTNND